MLSILFTVCGLLSLTSSQISHQYHFINLRKSWTEAQRYCREMYTDLATVNNADEMKSLLKSINNVSYDVYIGLYRSEELELRWSLPGFFYKKPACKEKGSAAVDKKYKWFIDSSQNQLVCFNENKAYIIFEDEKTWMKAREYCETFHKDLANARTCSENHSIEEVTKTKVWTGLFKEAWSWSDQSKSSFRFWNFTCPDCNKRQCSCPAVMVNGTSSEHSEPSFHFWNFLHPKCIRRQSKCTAVMANGTGKWYEAQCDVKLPFVCQHPDNLILVQKNLTWTEAVSYCKKHHLDLVSIHSEELQNRAAEKAAQASTSHIWMGLRYTCNFKFWFWIKNRKVDCYQNWASGHGPQGLEECGLSGAMESTGEHRWVGRPENHTLNFICLTCADTIMPYTMNKKQKNKTRN